MLGADAHDWVGLYRLYEVIEADVGGEDKIVKAGWTTKKAIGRFTRTANSPDAIGDAARHGKQSGEPPPNPMDLSEAISLVKVILHNWLRTK